MHVCCGYFVVVLPLSAKYGIKNANTNTPLFNSLVYGYSDLQATVTGLQFRTESRLCLPVYAHVSHDFTPRPDETWESLNPKIDETIDCAKNKGEEI